MASRPRTRVATASVVDITSVVMSAVATGLLTGHAITSLLRAALA